MSTVPGTKPPCPLRAWEEPSLGLGHAESWGQGRSGQTLPTTGTTGWLPGKREKVLSLQHPSLFSPLWFPQKLQNLPGKPGRQTLSPGMAGLAPKASAAWLWVSTTLTWSPRVCKKERWSAPSLGPNRLGCLLILVGTLVLSKNLGDSWRGLRQKEN